MKYLIELDQLGLWFNIQTNFVITDTLFELIKLAKGVDIHGDSPRNRYEISFGIGKMFDVEAVKKDISKIIDAYIQSNKNADKAEDKALMEFAKQAEQYNFVRNYKKIINHQTEPKVSLKLLIKGDRECRAPWFYRGLPILQMVQRSGIIHQTIFNGSQEFYDNMMPCYNALFIHLPHTKEDYELIERAAKWGLKVWIDLDDNYWEIPPLNRAHNFFDKDRLKIIDNCLRLADLITVSTDPLNEYISKFNFIRCPIATVNNAINDFVLGEFFPPSWNYQGGEVTINWRGSETHVPDLLAYKWAFTKRDNIKWQFWGYDPRLLNAKWYGSLDEYEVKPYEKSVLDYFMSFRRAATDVLFVPLDCNTFNIGKSGIAAMEAVWAGVYPLCCDLPGFKEFFPKSENEILAFIDGLAAGDKAVLDLCAEQYLHMVEVVKEKYLVSSWEQKRFELLDKMMQA